MSRRIVATVAAVLAGVAVACSTAAAGTTNAPSPVSGYSPAQVQALADASPFFTIPTAPVPVSPAAAYATAKEPGAVVEGSALAPSPNTTSICWGATEYAEQWGVWPLYQKVVSHDSWCSTNWSHLYYHSNYVTTGQVICSAYPPYHDHVAGGVSGQMTDEWEVGARFTCPTTLPGIFYNPTRSFLIVVAADGGYYHG